MTIASVRMRAIRKEPAITSRSRSISRCWTAFCKRSWTRRLVLRLRSFRLHKRDPLPAEIEEYRDAHWHREETARVDTVPEAERFIERVGFTACLTDARQPGPSLYVAGCGRGDAIMPRDVPKEPETSHTWALEDGIPRRWRVDYRQ